MRILFIILCLLCVMLAGCTPQKKDDAPPHEKESVVTAEFQSEEIDELINEQIEESCATPAEENTAALAALLEGVRTGVFPGTAGSSLSAAARAAAMADFFAESGMSPDEADACVQACIASLSGEDAQLFEMQLDAVASAFSNLTGENGAGLLSDCGYESSRFPWPEENVRNCFAALLGTD